MNSGPVAPVAYDERNGTVEEVGLDAVGCSTSHDENGVAEPCVGMEFDSEDAAKAFYDEYARRLGFRSMFGQCTCSTADGTTIARDYVCSREGVKRRSAYGCNASLSIEFKGEDKWIVVKFVREHNHSLLSPGKVHSLRPQRHFAGASKGVIEPSQVAVPNAVMHVSADGNGVPTEGTHGNRNASSTAPIRLNKNSASVNYAPRPNTQQRTLGRDAQNLLEYFKKMQAENPGFFYAIQLDEDSCMTNVFWTDSRSRAAYRHFGDTVTLDTSYRVNQYRVPFAPFTGVNHHGHTILFGCAILLDVSEASFIWLLMTFLTSMNDQQPSSITTDQDRALQIAVARVFPEARHCVSKWDVLREGQEKLAHVCHVHPSFQTELYNCINLTETIEEFESSWNFMIDKYHLRGHTWLEALYNSRAQWVPAYFRDSFFAVITPNQGYDGLFFDGFVNQQTALPMFFRQYEGALERCFKKELEADVETICSTPVLKTPSPMEKQAANLYTRRIFVKFQEELVETFAYTANRIEGDEFISTFHVAKFEDDQKAYMVTFNQLELRASCSCQMFEYSGMLCKHILTVFTVTNVLTLPSHYILKRWTRNAKTSSGTEERVGELNGLESFTVRYNNLCQEAIRYAEEGAVALETYNAAMVALREVGKKVSVVKKNIANIVSSSMQAGAVSYDERNSASDTAPLLWPHQDDVMRRFNLNHVGVAAQSVADLNLPCMAPVSLKQDESSPGNMASFPCLKSMTWLMENKNSTPGNRVAVISLKLLDNSKTPSMEMEVKFQLSKVTLEPMLRSMAYISDQLSTPANRVAVINLKLQDTETISGESEVRFQVSRDTLGAMLRSMAYIREQLSHVAEPQLETPPSKKQRK